MHLSLVDFLVAAVGIILATLILLQMGKRWDRRSAEAEEQDRLDNEYINRLAYIVQAAKPDDGVLFCPAKGKHHHYRASWLRGVRSECRVEVIVCIGSYLSFRVGDRVDRFYFKAIDAEHSPAVFTARLISALEAQGLNVPPVEQADEWMWTLANH